MDSQISFGSWLKQQRRRRGLTQETLGGLAGVSAIYLRKIEAGDRPPTRQVVEQLLEALRIPAAAREDILQVALVAPALALPQPHSNLPTPLTALIGRQREVEAITGLLRRPNTRLVTLIGVGGVGKTRLAVEAAATALDDPAPDGSGRAFSHGAFFIDLSPVRDPDLVVSTIAQTLAVRETGSRPSFDVLSAYLRPKRLLLVLDNFEQVIDAAPSISQLLTTAPKVVALVTSREVLNVRGERVFEVPPLGLPDDQRLMSAEHLMEYDAVRLFVERALDAKADFPVTEGSIATVAEICRRLDGLPLAIELAAARIRLLPPDSILRRLDSRLKLLASGARGAPDRQRTLRATIEWSYDLLGEAEQRLFRWLGVFVGGWTLDAAAAVTQGWWHGEGWGVRGNEPDVLEGLASLVGKSLIRQQDGVDGEPRFMMLETIREFALDRLAQSGEAEACHSLHARYFEAFVEQAEPHLTRPEQGAWLAQLEAEYDNLRAALEWATERDEPEAGLRLATALRWFWTTRGHLREGRAWIERLLRADVGNAVALRAEAAAAAGTLAFRLGDIAAATVWHEEALALHRAAGNLGGEASALSNLGHQALAQGDYDRAETFLAESIARFRTVGSDANAADALNALGEIGRLRGNDRQAIEYYEESLSLARLTGQQVVAAVVLANLGFMALRRLDYPAAEGYFRQSLKISRTIGYMENIAIGFLGLAGVSMGQGQPERAVGLIGAADVILEAVGHPLEPADRAVYEQIVIAARHALGESRTVALQSEGRSRTLEEAMAYAGGG